MYDSAGRVVTMVAGPSVAAGRVVGAADAIVSLNDVYPTLLEMAGLMGAGADAGADDASAAAEAAALVGSARTTLATIPPLEIAGLGLAGSSLLPLARVGVGSDGGGVAAAARAQGRSGHVIAQYHASFSVTAEFMVRRGDLKLIAFGPLPPSEGGEGGFPPQLFNLSADPWELDDLAARRPADVAALTALLASEVDVAAADADAKCAQRAWFTRFFLNNDGGRGGSGGGGGDGHVGDVWRCGDVMRAIFGSGFNATDAATVSAWLGSPCAW